MVAREEQFKIQIFPQKSIKNKTKFAFDIE